MNLNDSLCMSDLPMGVLIAAVSSNSFFFNGRNKIIGKVKNSATMAYHKSISMQMPHDDKDVIYLLCVPPFMLC